MSLEESIQANTAALRALIATLATQQLPLPAPVPAPAVAPAAEKPPAKKRATPATTPAAAATPTASSPTASAEPAQAFPFDRTEPATILMPYEAIKVPFLTKLVPQLGRDAAAELLRDFGVPEGGKLSDIPAEKWPLVLEEIEARLQQVKP